MGCAAWLLQYFLGNAYKAKVLEAMSADQLVDIILTNPTVHISPSYRDTVCWDLVGMGSWFCEIVPTKLMAAAQGFTAAYKFNPLSNIVFTRDQQITTKKGIYHMAETFHFKKGYGG